MLIYKKAAIPAATSAIKPPPTFTLVAALELALAVDEELLPLAKPLVADASCDVVLAAVADVAGAVPRVVVLPYTEAALQFCSRSDW